MCIFYQDKQLEKIGSSLWTNTRTLRLYLNDMKYFLTFDETGFRKYQINTIRNLDNSFANNRTKTLIQMAIGVGKNFTAITVAYRLLKYGKMNRVLLLVDTKSLGEQAERKCTKMIPVLFLSFMECVG